MTLIGFVVSDVHWEIVKQGLPAEVQVGWVASTPDSALEYLASPGTELLVVEAVPEILTADMVQRADAEGIPLAALLTSAGSEACAEERGVGQWIRQPDDLRRLLGVGPEKVAGGGQVWCVWGPHGSPGRTTIALGLAAELAHRGHRVVLVDADPQGGTVAPSLGLIDRAPGFLASMRRFRRGELTAESLRALLVSYRSGATEFQVLSGVARKYSSEETSTDGIQALFALCRDLFDLTLVDVGSESPPAQAAHTESGARATADVLEAADQIIALCRADPSGVSRFARAYPELAGKVSSPPRVWLNGVDTSRRALGEDATIREVLWRFAGIEQATALPWDPATCRKAAINAVTVRDMSSQSPLVVALAKQVDELTGTGGVTSQTQTSATSTKDPPRRQRGVSWQVLRQKWLRVTALR